VLNGKCSDDCCFAVERACDYCRRTFMLLYLFACAWERGSTKRASERAQKALEVALLMLRGLPSQ
jgi:hypothetical protein